MSIYGVIGKPSHSPLAAHREDFGAATPAVSSATALGVGNDAVDIALKNLNIGNRGKRFCFQPLSEDHLIGGRLVTEETW